LLFELVLGHNSFFRKKLVSNITVFLDKFDLGTERYFIWFRGYGQLGFNPGVGAITIRAATVGNIILLWYCRTRLAVRLRPAYNAQHNMSDLSY
jgi:hypothetical protein